MYVLNNNVTCFDSFGVELEKIKEIEKFINEFTIKTNIFRKEAYDPVMCAYFCIRFIDFMLKGKSVTDFTSLFSPNNL